jgi:hypothetical protein
VTRRTVVSAWILGGLLFLVFLAVLISPSREDGPPGSSYSAGADGLRLGRDLIERLGWLPEAREVAFSDTIRDPAPIQVLVAANISDREVRDLLRFVRGGGSVLIAGGGGSFADSLGVVAHEDGRLAEARFEPDCERRGTWQAELAQMSYGSTIGWSRPAPADTVGFGEIVIAADDKEPEHRGRAAVGMQHGAGRVVVVADESYLGNDVIRRCELRADVEFVRMIEYLSVGRRGMRVAFDEYHHGYGVRGGSFAAIRMYLAGTPSGRMLAQIAVGGLLLLFAAAPRPLAPRDPSHVARRSPIEHADALAHAYAGVRATRTATARLLAGVRRRARGRSRAADTDESFLAAASALSRRAAQAASTVSAALQSPLPEGQLTEVASALETIERELTRPSSSPR